MIEQISCQRIGDYMQAHIFEPLGLADISLFPTDSMKSRLAKISTCSYDTESLSETAHFMQAVLQMSSKEWAETSFQNGGGGCFARPQDYCGKQLPFTYTNTRRKL
jgi:CubicO group peptidase (beta-lactamase class C family)